LVVRPEVFRAELAAMAKPKRSHGSAVQIERFLPVFLPSRFSLLRFAPSRLRSSDWFQWPPSPPS
jgi:hypothetical protein